MPSNIQTAETPTAPATGEAPKERRRAASAPRPPVFVRGHDSDGEPTLVRVNCIRLVLTFGPRKGEAVLNGGRRVKLTDASLEALEAFATAGEPEDNAPARSPDVTPGSHEDDDGEE